MKAESASEAFLRHLREQGQHPTLGRRLGSIAGREHSRARSRRDLAAHDASGPVGQPVRAPSAWILPKLGVNVAVHRSRKPLPGNCPCSPGSNTPRPGRNTLERPPPQAASTASGGRAGSYRPAASYARRARSGPPFRVSARIVGLRWRSRHKDAKIARNFLATLHSRKGAS